MLHAAAPNACGSVRKHLYLAYGPRWMRPSGYNNHSPELLVRTPNHFKAKDSYWTRSEVVGTLLWVLQAASSPMVRT